MLPPCSEQGHDPHQLPSPHRGLCPLPGPAAADGRGRWADRKAWAGLVSSRPPASSSALPPSSWGFRRPKSRKGGLPLPRQRSFCGRQGGTSSWSSSCLPVLPLSPLAIPRPSLPALAVLILLRTLQGTVCLHTPRLCTGSSSLPRGHRSAPHPQAHFGFLPCVPLYFGRTSFRALAVLCREGCSARPERFLCATRHYDLSASRGSLSPAPVSVHMKGCAGHGHSQLPCSSDVLWPLSLTLAPFLSARGSPG